MANPRDHIRAAQAAELRGDKAAAIDELRKAAELYRRAGSSARALQLLRHARSLDPSRVDLAEEISRLDRQVGLPGSQGEVQDEVQRWLVEESPEEANRLAEVPRVEPWAMEPPSPVRPSELGRGEEQVEPQQSEGEPPMPESRTEERALIDRGPTRADPAIDAWCSFCCRPRAEVGELVAGPTGSFICAVCVGESRGLLALDDTSPAARPRPARRKDDSSETFELVGQAEARTLLERALQAGARRLLVMGPEGAGKTIWFQELARQERGTLVTVDALEQGSGGPVVLVEDVDRLPPEALARLASFLARHPDRTAMMSARGSLGAPSFVLQGDAGSLPVLSTRALLEATRGTVPMALLEQIQLAVALQLPSQAEFIEIARRRLAARSSELTVPDDVLAAIAAEAVSSPRAGHELNALLARVPAGSWRLAPGAKERRGAPSKRGAPAAKPSGRGRRKGGP